MEWSLTMVGLFVGLLVGMTGVGGAALLTPLLILMGIQPTIAVGTDLIYSSVTKIIGAVQHYRQKNVVLPLAGYLAWGSVPSAIAAVYILSWIESVFGNADIFVRKGLGIALIIIPLATLVRHFFNRNNKPNRWQRQSLQEKRKATILVGAVLGFIVGLTSVGSGSLFALAMMYFYRIPGRQIVGTDIAHAFLLVTAAGLAHLSIGNVNFPIVLNLLTGSVPGVIIGSLASSKIPTRVTKIIISSIILVSGIQLL